MKGKFLISLAILSMFTGNAFSSYNADNTAYNPFNKQNSNDSYGSQNSIGEYYSQQYFDINGRKREIAGKVVKELNCEWNEAFSIVDDLYWILSKTNENDKKTLNEVESLMMKSLPEIIKYEGTNSGSKIDITDGLFIVENSISVIKAKKNVLMPFVGVEYEFVRAAQSLSTDLEFRKELDRVLEERVSGYKGGFVVKNEEFMQIFDKYRIMFMSRWKEYCITSDYAKRTKKIKEFINWVEQDLKAKENKK